ncbi:SigE family RNA polymerase sigma factor [Xylanimonas oleitrophica]|uniref:SigE family RNA polymerase sigma factor n=1 Tax=Xylanimonas oleitrophica TaxID=2607479 RepID=A0A2W5WMZ6_9MICO|nr:SigE family RNA polymerase sigma factor [Xylanimonas oleitrophica]PZR52909.1 SigE family RNA polymerase sigma factor [Xylanimonas oleitrophica]
MSGVAVPADDVRVVVAQTTAVERFTAFATTSTPALFRIAYLLCGDEHRAHDLVQLALERTYRAWGRVEHGDPFAYARRVIATARVDTWRRTRREVLAEPGTLPDGEGAGPRTPDAGTALAERDRVVRALLALPVKQRRVVLLRYLLDRSEAETAEELGMALGSVKSTSARALARLRTLLVPDGGAAASSQGENR